MNRSDWERQAQYLGVDAIYFVKPRQWKFNSVNCTAFETNPFNILPGASCMIALIKSYHPFKPRKNNEPNVSAFYMASNALYHTCNELISFSCSHNITMLRADFPAKGMLAQCGIASIGKNSLAGIEPFGSRFTVQWLLTDAFEPNIDPYCGSICISCNRCINACPVSAIDENGVNPDRCMRAHLEGGIMPNHVKASLPALTGCEICQQACPSNSRVSFLETPADIASVFTYKRIIEWEPRDKKYYIAYLGKNMLTHGRLRAQALVLASHCKDARFRTIAEDLVSYGTDCEKDAAAYYLKSIG